MITFFAYAFYFLAASASPLQRRWLAVSKATSEKAQIRFAFEVVCFLVLGSLFLPFFSPFYLSGSPLYLFFLSLVCGLSGMIYFIANYIAQKHVDAGVTSIVSNIYTPVTIILSYFLINEKLTLLQFIGTVLLLVAMVIVSKKHHIGKFTFDKYFLMMLLSGVVLAFLLVAERVLVKTTGFTAGTMMSWWAQCFFLGIATLVTGSEHFYSKKDVLITGVLRFLQSLSWVMLVYIVGNLSLVSAITTFKVVVVFIAAAVFLGEREDWQRKSIGSIIAVIGLLLMK